MTQPATHRPPSVAFRFVVSVLSSYGAIALVTDVVAAVRGWL